MNGDLSKLDVFRKRMKKLNIDIEMWSNYPWIYIDKVNGNKIKHEDYFYGNHGFTIGFHPIKLDQVFEFTDITEIFKLIRKYR
jgi:hypothetical protein